MPEKHPTIAFHRQALWNPAIHSPLEITNLGTSDHDQLRASPVAKFQEKFYKEHKVPW